MRLSKNFTLEEFEKSSTAEGNHIPNKVIPGSLEYNNICDLVINLLQPLRDYIGKPIHINSGYRSKELNDLVKGVKNSQHLCNRGAAADIIVPGLTILDIGVALRESGLEWDQCVNEYQSWLHISYRKERNRKESLLYSKDSKGNDIIEKWDFYYKK